MVLSVSKIQLNIMYCCHYLITAKRVNGGSLNATLMWSPKPNVKITLIKTTLNLCDLLRDVAYSCPLNPGNYSLVYHKNTPDIFPKVKKSDIINIVPYFAYRDSSV